MWRYHSAARDVRSLVVLSVRKDEKMSASEVNNVKIRREVYRRDLQNCDTVAYLQFAKDNTQFQKQ